MTERGSEEYIKTNRWRDRKVERRRDEEAE
jgi:hypothetical protein